MTIHDVKMLEPRLYSAVLEAVRSVGLEQIRRGPFFGVGESTRPADAIKEAA